MVKDSKQCDQWRAKNTKLYQGFSITGSMSFPVPNTPSSAVVVSMAGWSSSSVREASVTEAHPKERVTIAKRAKIDLRDFIVGYNWWLRNYLRRYCE